MELEECVFLKNVILSCKLSLFYMHDEYTRQYTKFRDYFITSIYLSITVDVKLLIIE